VQAIRTSLCEDHLLPTLEEEGGFLDLSILHAEDGLILISTDEPLEGKYRENQPFFMEGKRSTFVQNVMYSLQYEALVMNVSTPIFDKKGSLIAVLVGHADLGEMSEIVQRQVDVSSSQETYLINEFNFFVTESRFEPGYALSKAIYTDGVNHCLAQNSGVGLYDDYRGTPVIGAYRWMAEREMCIITEIDQDEAFAPVLDLRGATIRAGVGAAMMVVFLGIIVSRSLTEPIDQLVKGAEAIGGGNLDYRTNIKSRDEIGQLSVAFDRMAENLHLVTASRDELDREIIERKKTEKELRIMESAIKSSINAIALADLEGNLTYVNPAFIQMWGYENESEVLGSSVLTFWQEEAQGVEVVETLSSQGSWIGELIAKKKDGSSFDVQISANLVVGEEGTPICIEAAFIDVSHRKQAEEALARSENLLSNILEQSPFSTWISDAKGIAIRQNPACRKLLGIDSDKQIIGKYNLFSDPEIKRQGRDEELRKVFFEGKPTRFNIDYDFSLVDTVDIPGATHKLLDMTIFPIKDSEGKVINAVIQHEDITERKEMEEALFRSEERLNAFMNSATEAFSIYDQELNLIDLNKAELSIWPSGTLKEDLIGKNLAELDSSLKETNRFDLYMNVIKTGTPLNLDEVIPHPKFGDFSFEVKAFKVGTGLGMITTDITDRKRAEEILKRALEDLERSNTELEQFAYVASHDLQEPLRMVSSYMQLLEKRYRGSLDDDADEFIEFAVDGAKRMQILINDLLDFSRVGSRGKSFESTDSEWVLERVLTNFVELIKENNATVTHDRLPTVMADEIQLEQVFQNLLGNAIKFRSEVPPEIHIGAERMNGEWKFSVRDNGIGIGPEYREKIFVIFKRLHSGDEYPGTGIGLAISKRIIERHGGRIWVESIPGEGSTFFFTIPAGREK
jgi:PAS domain S-box-containing protein